MHTIPHWIAGGAQTSPGSLPVYNPASAEQIASVSIADSDLVDSGVATALQAWPSWRDLPVTKRAQVLARWAAALRANATELVTLISTQNGKTLDDARGELDRGIDTLDAAVAGATTRLKGEIVEQTGTDIDTAMVLHPLGVCVGISPFNFPVMVPLAQASFALAAGNCVILKPSEQDPGPTVRIAELATEAGIPAGVLTVVNGDRTVVEHLIDHPAVKAISFVGSTPVAKAVYARATGQGKRAQAFGGAKNHLVVMPDANVSAAADALTSAAFGAAGQRCMAITTAVAIGDVADQLVAELANRAKSLRLGAGTDAESQVGPLISRAAQARVRGLVAEAIAHGAVGVVDRSDEQPLGLTDGYFVGPAVLDQVRPDMDVYRSEVFGPVLGIIRVESLDDALDLIERNPYGNGSAIFTRSGHAARTFQRRVTTGMVGVNIPIPVPVASFGFAGWKESAFGDTGLHDASWRFYTRAKYITSRWDDAVAGIDLGFRPN